MKNYKQIAGRRKNAGEKNEPTWVEIFYDEVCKEHKEEEWSIPSKIGGTEF